MSGQPVDDRTTACVNRRTRRQHRVVTTTPSRTERHQLAVARIADQRSCLGPLAGQTQANRPSWRAFTGSILSLVHCRAELKPDRTRQAATTPTWKEAEMSKHTPAFVIGGAIVIAALILARVPAAALLPYLLLACPLMMIVMMRGHGGHGSHASHGGRIASTSGKSLDSVARPIAVCSAIASSCCAPCSRGPAVERGARWSPTRCSWRCSASTSASSCCPWPTVCNDGARYAAG
jgi:hypothetical protein